ncbi:MAG: peptidoglycan DD-metalloendopeptidase family protein [Armatimonadota bacterium]|nr:peptidoglycan DD-metalloendopeptidase family protein [Armatimonadota bacterium]MDR7453665.1 peptidoglycan DD-metalloendopeptidase family protein [Armatimonadota bacterium]MDR7457126.1 peptidoglycan DD-metalloendopeptidase family protein [Armatimonadota bacterium]MDR7497133.1 peptidoglycan DD-metalloendopeptidase family protein [Armatimonadota bacterium]MDR7511382.1 peptidoglycan DD-metalloendopeptidase family protein [Armatimonadota bacterium]
MTAARWLRLVGALAVLGVVVGAFPPPGTAGPVAAQREELQRLQQQIANERRRLDQTLRRERGLAAEIQRLDRAREDAERALVRQHAELGRLRRRAEAAAADLARAERALARQQEALGHRLVDAHRYGRSGYLDVVLGASTFGEFVARARLVGAIVREDTRLIEQYAADRDRTEALRREVETRQAEVRDALAETDASRRTLEEQGEAKRELLRRVMRERTAAEQAVRELERESAELEALIRRLQGGGPLRRLTAGLVLPLRGPLTSRFGYRLHPLFGRRHFHAGIDIAAPRGAPVRAAAAGTVIFAGWYGGYGKLVVLDHGEGTSTLYGHLSAILVAAGARVARDQVVGRVGSTGYATGPHLHFEVRHDGRPVDPLR